MNDDNDNIDNNNNNNSNIQTYELGESLQSKIHIALH